MQEDKEKTAWRERNPTLDVRLNFALIKQRTDLRLWEQWEKTNFQLISELGRAKVAQALQSSV